MMTGDENKINVLVSGGHILQVTPMDRKILQFPHCSELVF
jgi:hypothetical protein